MSLQKCETAYGPMKFYGKDEYIGRSLYAYSEWSGDECDKLLSLANGICVDVGANVGYFSLALAASGFTTHAFEPQPALYALLEQNTANLPVSCHNVALSKLGGRTTMPRIRYGERGNYGGLSIGGRSELGAIDIEMRTLDSYKLRNVGLIKIDVEGHELEVLRGAVNTIATCNPILYVEDDRLDKRYDLRSFIKSLGYNIEEHNPRMYRQNNFRGLKKNIWDMDYISMNIICSK